MRFTRLLTAFASLLLWSSVITATAAAGEYNEVMNIGDPLPSFNDLPAVDGNTYSSKDFDAEVLVVVTLSNMCPFSTGIETDLVALVEQFKDRPVDVVGVSYNINKGDKMPAMRKRAEKSSFNFVYLRDESQELGRELGTTVTPEFFVFDGDRKLVYMGLLHNSPAMDQGDGEFSYLRGDPEDFYVADAIRAVLNGNPEQIDPRETRAYGCTVEYVN